MSGVPNNASCQNQLAKVFIQDSDLNYYEKNTTLIGCYFSKCDISFLYLDLKGKKALKQTRKPFVIHSKRNKLLFYSYVTG